MAFPKWLYRKHPELGFFQATLVAAEEFVAELGAGWSEDPTTTGFQVRPASQMHSSHVTDGLPLHEVVTDSTGTPVAAKIDITTSGDILNG